MPHWLPSSTLWRNDDQDGTEDTNATEAVALTIAAEAATEFPEQENDEDDNEDSAERHGSSPLARPERVLSLFSYLVIFMLLGRI